MMAKVSTLSQHSRAQVWRGRISPYIYLLPAVFMLLAFMYVPMVVTARYSLFDFKNFRPSTYAGLANYRAVLRDTFFWNSIVLTLKWVLMTAIVPGFVGLVLALLIDYSGAGRNLEGISRTILFMPMMMSLVAIGLLWTLIYNPILGLINAFLRALSVVSVAHPLNFFGSRSTALYFAFVPVVWQGSGFAMVIFSAALQGIPQEILEASVIDGAGKMTQILRIVIPHILRTITIVATINMISGFKAFDLLKVMTEGGPALATELTSLYLYRRAFFSFEFGVSSAIALLLFVIVLVCVLVVNNLVNRLNAVFEP